MSLARYLAKKYGDGYVLNATEKCSTMMERLVALLRCGGDFCVVHHRGIVRITGNVENLYEGVLKTIAPFIEKGNFVAMVPNLNNIRRYEFQNGQVFKQNGRILFSKSVPLHEKTQSRKPVSRTGSSR